MKLLRYILVLPLFLLPVLASAQTLPAFPMAFWGAVTLNGTAAPVGTVVNAYYGATLAGSATVQETGIYGYTAPTKQKLVVGEGTGTITFKVQSPGFNGGVETAGDAAITYNAFTEGLTVEKNLAFTFTPPAPPVTESITITSNTKTTSPGATTVRVEGTTATSSNDRDWVFKIDGVQDSENETVVSPWVHTTTATLSVGTHTLSAHLYNENRTVEIASSTVTVVIDPIPTPPSNPPSSGGGGGGGGGGGSPVVYSYGVKINGGAATTSSAAVTLTVTPTSNTNQMWVSNDPSFSTGSWISFQSTYPWTLTSGIGIKTVYVRYGIGNSLVANAQASIQLVNVAASQPSVPPQGQVLGASTVACFVFNQLLSMGSTGTAVTELQTRLIAEGVYSGPITGYFGALTKAGLIAFQKKNVLEQVGFAGPKTRALLNVCGGSSTPTTIPSSSSQPVDGLTETQIKSILTLLVAFGADQSVIDSVNKSLHK